MVALALKGLGLPAPRGGAGLAPAMEGLLFREAALRLVSAVAAIRAGRRRPEVAPCPPRPLVLSGHGRVLHPY